MARAPVKRKPTPSALRKKKAQHRIRRQIRAKEAKKKPNWRAAIAKSYSEEGRVKKSLSSKGAYGTRRRTKAEAEEEEARGGFSFNPNDEDEGEVQSDVDEEKEERMNQRDPLETQLFLKSLPLDTNEDELMRYFATHFGKVRRVFLVRNRIAKTLAGTAFVHCGTKELADKIFEHAQQNAREVASMNREEFKAKTAGVSHHQAKRMLYKQHAGGAVAKDPFLMLRESKFTVHRTLSRTDTQDVVSAQEKKKKRTKVAGDDPRNLYLLQEGLILPDTPAARGLHPRYLQMISDDYEARKQQLNNNNFFVSKTRLSVRNMPRTMTENEMRRIFTEPVRAYLSEHKEDRERSKWGKYGPIRNTKVLRDSAGVSRGYGFIEFVNHNVALHALRMINNNPTLFGDNRRLMVSFAIESINAVQKLQRLKELRQARLAEEQRASGKPAAKPGKKPIRAPAARKTFAKKERRGR